MPSIEDTHAVLILGMHRSGTSATTRAAGLLGLELGAPLLPPRLDNPAGFWELEALGPFHDALLGRLLEFWREGSLVGDWWRDPRLVPFRDRLASLLLATFSGAPLWGVKDPRLCLVVDFWHDVLEQLGCRISHVLVLRDPVEVAASLDRRDAVAPVRAQSLWLRHLLAAERSTRGWRRVWVSYAELLRDWRRALRPLVGMPELAWPQWDSQAEEAIDAFLDPTLRHHDASRGLSLPAALPWARQVYRALHGIQENDPRVDPVGALADLDRIDRSISVDDARWLGGREERSARWCRDLESALEHLEGVKRLGSVRAEGSRLARERETVEAKLNALRIRFEISESERRALRAEKDRDLERLGQVSGEREGLQATLLDMREGRARERRLLQETRDELARQRRATSEAMEDLRRLQTGQAMLFGALLARERTLEWFQEIAEEAERSARELARDQDAQALVVEEWRRRLSDSEAANARLRGELAAHREAHLNAISSVSWRITAPLRWGKKILRRGKRLSPAVAGGATPADPILPGRPFRQLVKPCVRRLRTLGIRFFTYGKPNATRVRVRIFEVRRLARQKLVHEELLEGWGIQDRQFTRFALDQPLLNAERRRLLIEVESLDGRPGATVTVGLAPSSYSGRILTGCSQEGEGLLELELNPLVDRDLRRSVAFVTGCPGDAERYRCHHVGESLRFAGHSVDVYPPHVFPWKRLLDCYRAVVVHRVAHTEEFDAFVERAKERGVHVIFDIDDLVFEPKILHRIDAIRDMSPQDRELFEDGIHRYRRSLSICDLATVSTDSLRKAIEKEMPHLRVEVLRNRADCGMVEASERALGEERSRTETVRIGYLSGSRTHRKDFEECVDALRDVLREHKNVRLVLVGHIELPAALGAFRLRVERHPYMDWKALPALYRNLDINLAPLERDNPFTEGKSELKFIEAGLLSVPTVASPVGGYRNAIDHGRNGFLCATSEEWKEVLSNLIEDVELRQRIGQSAREDVLSNHTSRGCSVSTAERIRHLISPSGSGDQRLTVAFVLRAPIAQTGGGYMKIFQIAHYLARRGHEVHVYVEPIAHLSGFSEEAIRDFCARHYGTSEAQIHRGHDAIGACDVAVATNWPTAPVVDRLCQSRVRAYLVQDYEPEFYEAQDPLCASAEETYDLPLLMIPMGRHLATRLARRNGIEYAPIDFALAPHFFEEREAVEEGLRRGARAEGRPVVLFFARPEIPRRCFELGVEALRLVHEEDPGVELRLYGMPEERSLPFPYVSLGVLEPNELARAMRKADVHLSFSKTNPTTVVFEAMASGCAAVELDEEGVRELVEPDRNCLLVKGDPESVAAGLLDLVSDQKRRLALGRGGLEATRAMTVENMCAQFESRLRAAVLDGGGSRSVRRPG